jgi:glycosyltransferase involved in cell wall biosynthesis
MVLSPLARGGSERQLLATAHGLVRLGYHVEIVELTRTAREEFGFRDELGRFGLTPRSATDLTPSFRGSETSTDAHGLRPFEPLIPYLNVTDLGAALHRIMDEVKPEIVHCWSDVANVLGGFVALTVGVPRVVLALRSETPERRNVPQLDLYRDAYLKMLGGPNVTFIANSAANRDDHERWLTVPSGTIKLLYNGFLPDSIRVRRGAELTEVRRQLGVPDGVKTVGAVMRLAPEKDPDLWLETVARIAQKRPDTFFLLAGYGGLADDVVKKIKRPELVDRIRLLIGPTPDPGLIYGALDVFLMTSLFEGTPNTLIEAQAAGVPIVAPRVGGVGETIVHGMTGLVGERDADSLAAAVLKILSDGDWRRETARRGPAFVARRFGHRRMIDDTVTIYGHPSSLSALGRRAWRIIRRIS